MIEELLKMYDEQRANFSPSEEMPIFVWQIDAFVERIRELETEADIWKERVQMRQELVEQYERDIAELKRELRAALERS